MNEVKTLTELEGIAYGYIRVSTGKQVASGLSLDAQAAAIIEFCRSKDWPFDPEKQLFVDKAATSRFPLIQRPAGKELMMRLRKGDVIVVTRLDRPFRNTMEILQVVRIDFKAMEVGLITLDFGGNIIDTRTATGKMLFQVRAVFAEFERDLISERTKAALAQSKGRAGSIALLGKRWKYSREYLVWVEVDFLEMRKQMGILLEIRKNEGLSYDKLAKFARGQGWPLIKSVKRFESRSYRTKPKIRVRLHKRMWNPRSMRHALENEIRFQEQERAGDQT